MASGLRTGSALEMNTHVLGKSVIELLRQQAAEHGDRTAFTFLRDGKLVAAEQTYRQLEQGVLAAGAAISKLAAPGERAVLLFPPSLEFLHAFLGCLSAGVVAVPAYPPRLGRRPRTLEAICADADPTLILTTRKLRRRLAKLAAVIPAFSSCRWLEIDDLGEPPASDWSPLEPLPETLAFLQYTSGSTSLPKGVMVTHANLSHNEEAIRRVFRQDHNSVIVSWLPLYHDMGLIGGMLQPLFVGAHCILLSPISFLQRPANWLQAISKYGATTSGGPSFAYELCVKRMTEEQVQGLDLSTWQTAFNGAEPVRAQTLERFAEMFLPWGFRRSAFCPCYGLAESTLLVTASTDGVPVVEALDRQTYEHEGRARTVSDAAAGASHLVGCGSAVHGQEVLIVDPESCREQPPGRVGEIWISGTSVASGYWNQPESTLAIFGAVLTDEPDRGPFLKSGDLGFLVAGELFVSGRIKDLLIIRGRNLYPQDLEQAAENGHPAVRPNGSAAFSVHYQDREGAVIVCEIDRRSKAAHDEVTAAIRAAIAEQQEVSVEEVVLIGAGKMPRTSSGKLRRSAVRDAYLAGELPLLVAAAASASDPEPLVDMLDRAELLALHAGERLTRLANVVRALVGRVLAVPTSQLPAAGPLVAWGLDSLRAVELSNQLEARFGVAVPLHLLLGEGSVDQLCEQVLAGLTAPEPAPTAILESALAREGCEEFAVGVPFDLTHGQEALWFLEKLQPGNRAYLISHAAAGIGAIDGAVLGQAFSALVGRHEALRCVFGDQRGKPFQRVVEGTAADFLEIDAASWDDSRLRRELLRRAWGPFELDGGPLIRLCLLRQSPDRFVLVLALHHLIGDFWSLGILLRELEALYLAVVGSRTVAGAAVDSPLPAGWFAACVRQQRELLQTDQGKVLRRFWRQQLGGHGFDLRLPADRPRPSAQTFRGETVASWLGERQAAALEALGWAHSATLYVTLLASFQVLLCRLTGSSEPLIGSPTSGREAGQGSGLAGLVGYFVNPVVLRTELGPGMDFSELLGRTRATVLAALEHAALPFALLAQDLQPQRDASRSPIFQAMFAFQQEAPGVGQGLAEFSLAASGSQIEFAGFELKAVDLEGCSAQFDLCFSVAPVGDRLRLELEFSTDLFDRSSAQRFLGAWLQVVEEVLAKPRAVLSALSLLTASQRQQLLVEWNDTQVSYAATGLVPQLLAAQASRDPQALAIDDGQRQLTYGQLLQASAAQARRLIALGAGSETCVGLLADRSAAMVVGALAILKTGAAYLPLDPKLPPRRLAWMVEDLGVELVLSDGSAGGRLAECGAQVVNLDEPMPASTHGVGNSVRIPRQSLAYVIYTSGSSGRPKPVGVSHASLQHLVHWYQRTFQIQPGDRAAQLAGPAFDVAVGELWCHLAAGASLHLPADEIRLAPGELRRWLVEERIQISDVSTPMMERLCDFEWPSEGMLRALTTGGDRLRLPGALPWNIPTYNIYGPTECTVNATAGRVGRDLAAGVQPPIGRPLSNTRVFLVDGALQAALPGAIGELCLSGVGLARGYLGRPGLTAGSFVANPFSVHPGERLYRTGDLARYRGDGQLEFLGRFDQQVKLRGFRIELGEIEAACAALPEVSEAVVVLLEDPRGAGRLAAYLVPRQPLPSFAELRQRLAKTLPEYMLPAAWVELPRLPLTRSGKIDRAALPVPRWQVGRSAEFASVTEQRLGRIWGEVLGRGEVGRNDDFFALGGHSLLGTQVSSRIAEEFGVELPLRALFEAPELYRLAEVIEQAQVAAGPTRLPLTPIEGSGPWPLSFPQQRLWFLSHLPGCGAAYNMPSLLRLAAGVLERRLLDAALTEIARRQTLLRTCFVEHHGKAAQQVMGLTAHCTPRVDLDHLGAADRQVELAALARSFASRRFDLRRGPLLRTLWLDLGAEGVGLAVCLHHIIADGWSIDLLLSELAATYGDLAAGHRPSLGRPAINYQDFAGWQRRWFEDGVYESQIRYWRQQLAGSGSGVELAGDRPRPATFDFAGGRVERHLTKIDLRALEHFGQAHGGSLFMTVLAAFQVLLFRLTGEQDQRLGTAVANRNRLESERLLGVFVNTQVMRLEVEGSESFLDLLRLSRRSVLEADAHQDVPFELLVQSLDLSRDRSRNPLFQIMLLLEEPPALLRLGETEVAVEELVTPQSKFDLSVGLRRQPGGDLLWAEYSTALYDSTTVLRWLEQLQSLLVGILDAPRQPVASLPILDRAQRQQLLVEWADSAVAYASADQTLTELIQRNTARGPDIIAVVADSGVLSFAELWRRAGWLADHLGERGVGPESVVGVLAERSLELLIGLVGILRAGAAYLPLDPDYPAERLLFMIEDSGASLVVAQSDLAGALPSAAVPVLRLDEDLDQPVVRSATAEPGGQYRRALPENLAYVIYTSGSTGRPKGVMNQHRGVVNRLLWTQSRFALIPGDRILQKTPTSFDVSVWELFWPLLCGATVVMARPGGHRDSAYLVSALIEQRITTIHFVPSLLRVFLLAAGVEKTQGILRQVICSGEALTADLVRRADRRLKAPLHNLYGPTEAAVDVTARRCGAADHQGMVPIGRPIDNVRIRLLDRRARPVPVGVAGELCIGGVALARGYRQRPALTARTFVPDPLAQQPPAQRLYRSGDLARYRADGSIEYLGRLDHQVKLRGFRIELGEIEAALENYPRVAAAAAAVGATKAGESRLDAYVVGLREGIAELREHLGQCLPGHMIPATFTFLGQLPLNASGKLDRQALPAPDSRGSEFESAYVAAGTAAEKCLSRLWAAALGVERVGIHDDFFALGGDSILSLQVVAQAAAEGLRLGAQDVFQAPTIAELARLGSFESELTEGEMAAAAPMRGEVPLSPIQQWFFEQQPAEPWHFNQALLLATPTALDPARLAVAARLMLRRHDALRLRFEDRGGRWRQHCSAPDSTLPWTRIDLSHLRQGHRSVARDRLVRRAQASLNLSIGPVVRWLLLDHGEQPGRLLWIAHHLVVDGVSWRLLVLDLERTYGQLEAGSQPSPLPPTTSYQTWVEHLMATAGAEARVAEVDYWRHASRPSRPLPVDIDGGRGTVGEAEVVRVQLPVESTQTLLEQAPRAYRTDVQEILLTALAETLTAWSGDRAVKIDLEGHGRQFDGLAKLDVARTVGWFTSLFPLRLELGEVSAGGAHLKQVKEQLRAVPDQGRGWGMLRYLSDGEDVVDKGSAEVLFNYLGQLDGVIGSTDMLKLIAEEQPAERSRRQQRSHLLEISVKVREGRLLVDWEFSRGAHRRQTIGSLANDFIGRLGAWIDHCSKPANRGFTPSDFPLADLDQPALDELRTTVGEIEDLLPLTPTQEGMLFHALAAPASDLYTEQMSCELLGELDSKVLLEAWGQIASRHPMLRALLLWQGLERPLVAVLPEHQASAEVLDWSALPAVEQDSRVAALMVAERQRGFDLSRRPAWRLAMIELGAGRQRLIWSFHHLLLDGWSVALVIRELFELYDALIEGRPAGLSAAPSPSGHLRWLQGRQAAPSLAYWRRRLSGFDAPTPLGIDRPASLTEASSRVAEQRLVLPARLAAALDDLVRRHRLTLNTLFESAWARLLSLYSGHQEVVFGTVAAGRQASVEDSERMVGVFINTLPARLEVPSSATLIGWLRRVQAGQSEARSHQHTPLAEIQQLCGLAADQPLFESLLVFENYPLVGLMEQRQAAPRVGRLLFFERTNYPLVLSAARTSELAFTAAYDPARFDPTTIGRLLDHLTTLLRNLVAGEVVAPSQWGILSRAERHQLLWDWNDTAVSYGADSLLGPLLARRADCGGLQAVAQGAVSWSYAELWSRVDQLSGSLRSRGMVAETRVGLSSVRSPEMVAGLLAILSGGGTVVPLDPDYPAARLSYLIEDSGTSLLLVDSAWTTRPQTAGLSGDLPVIELSQAVAGRRQRAATAVSVTAEQLAYLIYTSGSTGRPKGVMVSHRAIANRVLWMQSEYPLEAEDRVLQKTPLSFDASMWELLTPLLAGASVELARDGGHRDMAYLRQLIEARGVSVLQLVPSQLQVWLEEVGAASCGSLRWVFSGGEALPEALRGRFESLLDAELINLYGPTETAIDASHHRCRRGQAGAGQIVPIGRPLGNLRLSVLDAGLEPLPAAAAGELYVAGPSLARGYQGRAALTAEHFVPDPWSPRAGGRLYRTGDRTRRLADGRLEYLGRADQQVKVRGVRIEPGEIEARLAEHPAIEGAAVVARGAGADKALVAYVVGRSQAALDTRQLRQDLAHELPPSLVPSTFVVLGELPRLTSGKVDRRALASREVAVNTTDGLRTLPRNLTEEMVAAIWMEVLGLDRIHVEDDFFTLGGHSLHATRAISRLQTTLAVEIPLLKLFELPTLGALSAYVEVARGRGGDSLPAPIERLPRSAELPASFAQRRLWFIDQLDPESPLYNLPLRLRMGGVLDIGALREAFSDLVARQEVLRSTFEPADGAPRLRLHGPVPVALPVIDLVGLRAASAESEAARLAAADAARGFDLRRGPLLRTALLRLAERDYSLLLNVHHIVGDGWSTGLLLRELATHYGARRRGCSAQLAELPVQYVDYAAWQQDWLQGQALTDELEFWRSRLAGAPALLNLPTDRPRPAVQSNSGASLPVQLDASRTAALESLGRQHRGTLFMVLLAAWSTLLARYSGSADLSIGVPVAGRTRLETEPLVGCFVNTLVFRLQGLAEQTFLGLIGQVREVTLATSAHQDLPFEKLVEELEPERSLSFSPLFQVMLALQNVPAEGVEFDRLEVRLEDVETRVSRYDLSLFLAPDGDRLQGFLEYSDELFDNTTIARLWGHLETLLAGLSGAALGADLAQLPLLSAAERRQLLGEWNDTASELPVAEMAAVERPGKLPLSRQFESRVARQRWRVALTFADQQITYGELEARANRLAHYLISLGAGPESLVGIHLRRTPQMVVAMLAVLKAGAAYLPLDPSYPPRRLAYLLDDAAVTLLIADAGELGDLEDPRRVVVDPERDQWLIDGQRSDPPSLDESLQRLAYVIYTSGSTGRPKGVMVDHASVANFFVGMDRQVGRDQPGTWLAVTSISFDISVLELLWPLTRGYRVVLQPAAPSRAAWSGSTERTIGREIDFSLFYFASDLGEQEHDRYRLLLEGARIADRLGFAAVWTPERHFHHFGGLYPNPSVVGAAIAAITERVQIRAGSVVLPLHNPVRVAEEWSVVDNISGGRVGISIASGWVANDFVLAPDSFQDRHAVMFRNLETIRRLWRGEKVTMTDGVGAEAEISILPPPVQPELPIWVTAAGSPETFRRGGELGAHLLTHMLGQDIDQLAANIQIYRQARQEAGHEPQSGKVSVMLHAFVADDLEVAKETVRQPFYSYLRGSAGLVKNLAVSLGWDLQDTELSAADMEAMLEFSFERYFATSGLMGTRQSCFDMVARLSQIGVDEVACLIDFGIAEDQVLAGLSRLAEVQSEVRRATLLGGQPEIGIGEQIRRHRVTHFQCTPSMATMLALDPEVRQELAEVDCLLLGGEALPPSLAESLAGGGEIHNMYGPTETTIWSSTWRLERGGGSVPIGRPIANTELHVVGGGLELQPVGIPGLLFIAGQGVVRGYLARPALTADCFVPNPFSSRAGRRMYATGDLARRRRDGVLEFLGRVDQQVKVRGHRIELGEIESHLDRHPGVAEAVVVTHESATADLQLVAYWVAAAEAQLADAGHLRNHLRSELPEHMVPTLFVDLEQLPRTPNGKLDRAALPAPRLAETTGERLRVAPRSALEEALVGIWSELLGRDDLDIHDDFFELGGHSLLAARLIFQLRSAFKIDLPLRQLFEATTIAQLASALEDHERRPGMLAKRAELLLRIQQMSPDELADKLAQRRRGKV